jgi:hypothetical protein
VSERRRIIGAVVGVTGVLGILLALHPVTTERLLSGYVLALAAIALAGLTRLARPASERRVSHFEEILRGRREEPGRPSELVRTEREITLGVTSAGHLHRRLLPLLREAAAARIAAQRGVELAGRPEAARELLGEDVWEWLRPDRPAPEDRHEPGISLARLERLVGELEAL